MIQVVKYSCCGKVFAACHDPSFKTDKDWKDKIEEYSKRGNVVEIIENNNVKFENCNCSEKKDKLYRDIYKKGGFGKYLINVGIRSSEFNYSEEEIFHNIKYFQDCFEDNLSEYKALLFLYDFLEKENK